MNKKEKKKEAFRRWQEVLPLALGSCSRTVAGIDRMVKEVQQNLLAEECTVNKKKS
jgi:hypothetical protein